MASDQKIDTRFCYGVTCLWSGPIWETRPNRSGLPGCPYCGGVLFEMENESEWWRGIDGFERGDPLLTDKPHPGYRAMWEWAKDQKRCFGTLRELIAVYEEATGIAVSVL